MRPISIGVVAEGKVDYLTLEWALTPALRAVEIEPVFIAIQPVRDNTSGSFGEGGWRQVFQWCVRNPAVDRSRFFGGGLFAMDGVVAVDLIIVHVDGDIIEALRALTKPEEITTIAFDGASENVDSRLAFCHAVVNEWLRGTPPTEPDMTLPAPIIHAGEAWILGCLDKQRSAEECQNPKREFAILYCNLKGKQPPADLKRLRNHTNAVVEILKTKEADHEQLLSSTISFPRLVQDIVSIIS